MESDYNLYLAKPTQKRTTITMSKFEALAQRELDKKKGANDDNSSDEDDEQNHAKLDERSYEDAQAAMQGNGESELTAEQIAKEQAGQYSFIDVVRLIEEIPQSCWLGCLMTRTRLSSRILVCGAWRVWP